MFGFFLWMKDIYITIGLDCITSDKLDTSGSISPNSYFYINLVFNKRLWLTKIFNSK